MSSPVEEVTAAAGLVVVGAAFWVSLLRQGASRWKLERRERGRAGAAHAAAVEASLSDAAFSPDRVVATVNELVERASRLWGGEIGASPARSDDHVVRDWADATISRFGPVAVVSPPNIDFLQVINRDGEADDRVVLRVRVRLHRAGRTAVGEPRTVTSDSRWTLGRSQGNWRVLSISSDPLATHLLDAGLVADPSVDQQRMREQALVELAGGANVGRKDLAGLVSADASPDQQLLELAMIDERFDRQLIDATIEHAIQAWEAASTGGGTQSLAAVASTEAVKGLLVPSPGRLLLLRDAKVESWRLGQLALNTTPPTLKLTVTISAVRYLVTSRKRRHVSGNIDNRRKMVVGWTLALRPGHKLPWRVAHTTNPADGIKTLQD